MVRPIALWATPRTISTAFDRMVRERDDHRVFTEPFSVAYYDGPEQCSTRYPVTEPEATFDAVLSDVVDAGHEGPVFVKDMAYHLGPRLEPETLESFTNTFLVRDPARSLPSIARIWPDFTTDEAGYEAQREAFDMVQDLTGEVPPVIEATDLQSDPDRVVAAWCDRVGIDHRPDALSWEPGLPEDWARWAEWFDGAASSTGFQPPAAGDEEAPVPPKLAEAVAEARHHYEHLRTHAL